MSKPLFVQPESAVLSACMDYLAINGTCPCRHNNGASYDPRKHVYRRKPTGPGYEPGQADILASWKGRALAVECKATDGKQDKDQIAWQARWEKAGGVYLLVKSLSDLIEGMGDGR